VTRLLALASAGCILLTSAAQAQSYPTRPITIVVTAAAGGVSDIIARAIGQRMTDAWGQQVIIENRGGGAHIIGEGAVASAKPDGHTLLVAERSTFVINPTLYPKGKLPYDPETAFIPITGLVRIHHAMITSPKFEADSVAGLLDVARQKPDQVTYGTAGVASGPHVNMLSLQNLTGTKMVAVHYKGATPSLNDVMGGHTNMMLISVSSALPSFRDGKVKMIGIGSAKRLPQVSDVPTIAESGKLPGYLAGTWFGMSVTGGTPPDVVAKISGKVQKILNDPVFQKKLLDRQLYESMATTPEKFAEEIKAERVLWAKVIREQKMVLGK
jgi:tripartite-type tricarboxylate transporter receptor subunit TctC